MAFESFLFGVGAFESCFPGQLFGEAEIACPHCQSLLTVSVDDSGGTTDYQCGQCGGRFTADWWAEEVTRLERDGQD